MNLPFLQRRRDQRRQQVSISRPRYASLLFALAEKGDLSAAEDAELQTLQERLGKSDEVIEGDVALIVQYSAAEKTKAELPQRIVEFDDAQRTQTEAREKLDRLIEERDADVHNGYVAIESARSRKEQAEAAAKTIDRMKIDRPDLFGPRERTPAHLLLATPRSLLEPHLAGEAVPMIEKFITSARAEDIAECFAMRMRPIEESLGGRGQTLTSMGPDNQIAGKEDKLKSLRQRSRQAAQAAEEREKLIAKSGAKVFTVNPADVRNFFIDVEAFDWQPAPGQNPQEFASLQSIVKAAAERCAGRWLKPSLDGRRELAATSA